MATVPAWADYGPAKNAHTSCSTCDFYDADTSRCERFEGQPRVEPQGWCNQWSGKIDKQEHMPTSRAEPVDRFNDLSDQDKLLLATASDQLEPDQVLQKTRSAQLARLSSTICKMSVIAAPGVPPYEPTIVKDTAGTLYLVSHATTRYNSPGKPHQDRVQGWLNVPLNPQGRKEAGKLGQFLKDRGVQAVHSSDLARSSQTAKVVGHAAGLKPVISQRYRPWNLGTWAGHSSADAVPKLKRFMTKTPSQPVDGGESFDTFKGRFIPALDALLKQVEAGKTVALITHSRNIELAQGWVQGRAPRRQVDTSEISADDIDPATVFAVTKQDGKWMMRELADETGWVRKSMAAPLHLRVAGVHHAPSGHYIYRMETRDGHYVGRTLPTRTRARKGEALKITPTAWSQDVQTDIHWVNPIVASSYTDAPHSWRELQALAGAHLEKDYAPGAEEASPTQDQGGSALLSGPTLSAVHVAVPLPDLSQAYLTLPRRPKKLLQRREQENAQLEGQVESVKGNREVLVGEFLPVQKADKMKQIQYGVVLEPNVMDSQNDFMLPRHVEATAHNYLKKAIRGQSSVAKILHRTQGFKRDKGGIIPVESFIAPCDFPMDNGDLVKKGSWVLAMHYEDPALWQRALRGEFGAFSVGGSGIRQSIHAMPRPDQEPLGYIGNPPPGRWPEPRPSPGQLGAFM